MGGCRSGDAEGTWRAGALVLSLLATPLQREILDELSRGPGRLGALRRRTGSPPQAQATVRARLEQLRELGVIAKRRFSLFPNTREYVLTSVSGRELLFVLTSLDRWLASAPEEPVSLGSERGRAAIEALAQDWSPRMLRALAAGAASLEELDGAIDRLTKASLERRLDSLRDAGLIAATNSTDGQISYEITDWMRKSIGPISAAARWERRHLPDATASVRPIDVEAGFLLAIPLLKPPPELAGSCRLGVEFGEGSERRLAGVTVEVGQGRILSCTTRMESSPVAWATGPPAAWLRTTIEADPDRLELGGNQRLVHGLIEALNQVLFGPARPLPPSAFAPAKP